MPDLELKTIAPKAERDYLVDIPVRVSEDTKQRGLMLGSLCLLLLALAIVLWHDRDFWFPDDAAADAESEQPVETPLPSRPANTLTSTNQSAAGQTKTVRPNTGRPATDRTAINRSAAVHPRTEHSRTLEAVNSPRQPAATTSHGPVSAPKNQMAMAVETPSDAGPDPPPVAINRTVLPPLEVEVVAGDNHRTVRPGSSSVHVDLQPGVPPQPAPDAVVGNVSETETAAHLTNDAAERVQMSANASEIVASPVKPSYPLLARQMRVQGSVILQAMIGRDGIIQNLRLVSGPHILAAAAENAVRQWHFKPHFQGGEAVETQAKITVNFTISTN